MAKLLVRDFPRRELLSSVPLRVAEADKQSKDHRFVQQQDRQPAAFAYRKVRSAEEPLPQQQQTEYGFVLASFC